MFVVIACMLAGIVAGYLFRKLKLRFIHWVILVMIWLLLFLLGLEVGTNDQIIGQFGHLGFEAFLLAFAGTLGSVLFAGILWLTLRTKQVSK